MVKISNSPLIRAMRRILRLSGQRCQLCASVLSPKLDQLLCPDCARLLTARQGGYCPHCALFFADPAAPIYPCQTCRTTPPAWTQAAFHSAYTGTLKELIHHFKFGHNLGLLSILGDLTHQAWIKHDLPRPDLLLPVPLHPARLQQRGFNQSAELARILSRQINVPLNTKVLHKIRNTAPQSSLGRAERLRNVHDAFQVRTSLAGLRVVLLDDVLTTGSTLRACAKVCKDAGAAQVDVLVLGRAL